MFSSADVKVHHSFFVNDLTGEIGVRDLAFVPLGGDFDWHRSTNSRDVFFELAEGRLSTAMMETEGQDPIQVVSFIRSFERPRVPRDKGEDVTVFKVQELGFNLSIWASWTEKWQCLGRECFDLVSGGWTFFFQVDEGPFTQLLRAEWDQPLLSDLANGLRAGAGQPHWHVDLRSEVIHESVVNLHSVWQKEVSELVELSTEIGLQSLDEARSMVVHSLHRAGMHFPMAGTADWSWQIQIEGELIRLRRWGIAVLRYVADEVKQLKLV
ncbi:MAG: hypothetical protein ACK5UR_05145 [Armatimonadota bacterium]|jgi:hypothetical protein|nr:hypothetical protein [Fimbriimonadaceae bacterium]